MRVVFSNRAFSAVLAETAEKIATETGGLFLGRIQDDTWYIVEAIDPGPKSIFEIAYFEYDQQYTQHLINKIANLYDQTLDLIGLWHRHPGSFDQFSSTDDGTNAKYASMRKEGAISGLVNIDPNFRFTMYHVAQPCRYKKITYEVGDDLIPDIFLKFKTPDRFYDLMKRRLQSAAGQNAVRNEYKRTVSLESFMRFILPALSECECTDVETNSLVSDESIQDKLIDAVIEDVTFMADKVGVQVSIALQDQYLVISQEAIDKTTKLYFMYSEHKQQIVFSYADKCYLYRNGLFEEACEKAKAQKARQTERAPRIKGQPGVLDSVIRIIKLNKNEE